MEIDKIEKAVAYLNQEVSEIPSIAIVLGSGLGSLSEKLTSCKRIPYDQIPYFPTVTVEGHAGELLFGKLDGTPVLAMAGRFHFYEGYPMSSVIFPFRVMKLLGVTKLVVTNAAGGLNPEFVVGDIMLIEDIISLLPANPLRGANLDDLGSRFPDMSQAMDIDWMNSAKNMAIAAGIDLKTGTYMGVTGPSLETKSEINYFRLIGGDAVGMSTVPEIIAANHMGIKVLGFSVITNECIPSDAKQFAHADVVEVAGRAGEKLGRLVSGLVKG